MSRPIHIAPLIIKLAKRVGVKQLTREYNKMYGMPILPATMSRYLNGGRGYEKGPPKLVKKFLISRFVRW